MRLWNRRLFPPLGQVYREVESAGYDASILYATGCGVTSPALTPGQLATQANSLVTLPQVTIGGNAATVVSAGVLPGTGGVYQITVQVPTNAANGDLPIVAQLGTVSSASTLITVQR